MNKFIVKPKPPEMDSQIWSNLPEELLDRILCFLPIKSIFNLRSTCKRFKSLLFTPFFLSKFYSSPSSSSSSSLSSPFSSFLLLSHPHFNRHFPLYNSISGFWRESSASRSLLNPCTSSSSLLSSSNGILCFHLPTSFLVSNLLSGSSTLVKFPKLPFNFELINLVSYPNGFKIFVSTAKQVFLYCSKVKSWKIFDGFEPILNDNIHKEGVYRDGFLYFTSSNPFSIVSFDLEKGVWGTFVDEMPMNDIAFARLVMDDEDDKEKRVFVIGGVGRNGISRCLKLWEFVRNNNNNVDDDEDGDGGDDDDDDDGEYSWVEIESLPDLMYKKLVSVCYHNYEHIYCFWHSGLICIGCYTWPEVLYYRVSRKTWHWLPKCPSLPDKWSCGFRWFSFVPKLYASF